MPKLADKDTIEEAYLRWKDGQPIARIADDLGLTIVQISGWRSVHGWTARKKNEDVEQQAGAVLKAGNDLFALAPKVLDAAINLAFNAESESVRATQQRYLLGAIGISPDTATERVRQLAMEHEKIRKLAETPLVDVSDAIELLDKEANGGKEW